VTTAGRVPRPLKKAEFTLAFITTQAEKGWVDCLAAAHNAAVDAWECLTKTPDLESERLYRLKAELATGTYNGMVYDRYQYKITNGGRIWYFIQRTPKDKKSAGLVLIERGHHVASERDGLTRRGRLRISIWPRTSARSAPDPDVRSSRAGAHCMLG
jgi:hypothetical protein